MKPIKNEYDLCLEVARRTPFTLGIILVSYAKHQPTNNQAWKKSFLLCLNESSALGYEVIAPRWPRKRYIKERIGFHNA